MSDEIATLKRQIATLQKQMAEMQIYHYFPVTPTYLVDSAGTTWDSAVINTGTYTFRPQDNANIWPARARAVQIFVSGRTSTAAQTNYVNVARTSGGTSEMVVRGQANNITYNTQGVQAVDVDGYFYVTVIGAAFTMTLSIVGYIV